MLGMKQTNPLILYLVSNLILLKINIIQWLKRQTLAYLFGGLKNVLNVLGDAVALWTLL